MQTFTDIALENIEQVQEKSPQLKQDESEKNNIAILPKPEIETNLKMWEEMINLYFKNITYPAKLCLAVQAQHLIKDITNPFALFLIDAPSAGKTFALDIATSLNEIAYATDDFTVASFVSHSANVKKKDLEKNDLLPRIKGKTLVCKEMGTFFSKPAENLQAELGVLTRILDGDGLTRDSGVHGSRGYKGNYCFMMLGASTPIKPAIWKIIGNLGARIFFYHLNQDYMNPNELVQIILQSTTESKKACKQVTKEFIQTLWNKHPNGVEWNREEDKEQIKSIALLATLLSRLRGIHKKEEYSDEAAFIQVEHAPRLTILLYNFARGNALINGRMQLSHDDTKIVLDIAISSAPPERAKIIKHILIKGGEATSKEIQDCIQKSSSTTYRYIEALIDLKILKKKLCALHKNTDPDIYTLVDDLQDILK
jgi:hypothetical protein